MGVMSGAIFFDLFTPLGVDPYGGGGALLKQVCFTWVMAAVIVVVRRAELLALAGRYIPALARLGRA